MLRRATGQCGCTPGISADGHTLDANGDGLGGDAYSLKFTLLPRVWLARALSASTSVQPRACSTPT